MSSTANEILNEKLKEEFRQTYTEAELWQKYLEEYQIVWNTDNYAGSTKDEHFEEFVEYLFEEFKEMRLE
jgi:hypothetical protein